MIVVSAPTSYVVVDWSPDVLRYVRPTVEGSDTR